MKRFFLVIFVAISVSGSAQFSKDNHLYLSTGRMLGNFKGFDGSINYVYKQKYTLDMGFTALWGKPNHRPGGFIEIDFFFPPDRSTYDHFRSYKLLFGAMVNTKFKWLRFNLKAGAIYSRMIQVTWEYAGTTGGFFRYDVYNYYYSTRDRMGFMMEPSIELIFNRWLGFSISPYLQVNDQVPAHGVSFKLMAGLLRI